MLVCATCGSRWDEDARLATTLPAALCPMCEGVLVELGEAPLDEGEREPIHADVARVLREHLLGVGA
jgi:Zn-finger nucleic acid-binding protein